MEIGAILCLTAMAVIAFVCAPIAFGHSAREGRYIQGHVFLYSFNAVGIAMLIAICYLIAKAFGVY